jgi:D-alanyl-D-alanine carboxypeptidase
MDVSIASLNYDLAEELSETPEGKWLAENAHIYGFIISYPKGTEHIAGYQYEPWHIRYLGKDLAARFLKVN